MESIPNALHSINKNLGELVKIQQQRLAIEQANAQKLDRLIKLIEES